jgi:hypothetical protein
MTGVLLVLSQGGMVRGLDMTVARANEGNESGLYDVNGMSLYVSNSTGIWIGCPARFGVLTETTEFVLHAPPLS